MEQLLNTREPLGRGPFVIRFAILVVIGLVFGFILYKAGYHFLHFKTVGVFWALCLWVFVGTALFMLMIRRAKDLDLAPVLLCVPGYNIYLLYLLFGKPGKA